MARIFLEQMEGEKGPTRAEQLHKTADLAVLTTDGVANPGVSGQRREPRVSGQHRENTTPREVVASSG